MHRPALRWSLLAVAIATAAGLCYWAATLEQQSINRRRIMATANSDSRTLRSALSDARRALSAMAAPGQAAVSWSRQAATSIETARGTFTTLAKIEGGPNAGPLLERLDKLVEAESRVREHAVSGRPLMASDVAFGEALPHVDFLDQQAADASMKMTEAADKAMAGLRDQQLLALAAALGVLAIVGVILTPVARVATDVAAPAEGANSATDADPAASASLSTAAPEPAPPVFVPTASASMLRDLAPLAAACDGLARLSDGETLPRALDSVRPALGARGVVVWLADGERRRLHVVAASGYDKRVVERFPAIDKHDHNPTSRAYASGVPCSAPATAGEAAALAVPITGARGTTGVLSAELADGADAGPEVLARARIIAAQLATLLEPLPAAQPAPAGETPIARVENA